MLKLSVVARFAATGAVAIGTLAAAQTQVITLVPAADATIFRNNSDPTALLSSGAADAFFVGRTLNRANTTQRTLLRFDLSSIPCGSTIQSVSLTLTLFAAGSGAASPPIGMHRVLAPWAEGFSGSGGGAGASSQPGDSDWTYRINPTDLWATPGGDFISSSSASRTVPRTIANYTWASTPQLVADVQGWLSAPTSNAGWLLRGDEITPGSTRKFWSREALSASTRPALRIEYVAGGAVSVTTQPSAARSCLARTASFAIAASGTGLSYRWQIEAPPAGSGNWSDLADGAIAGSAVASGTSTTVLTLSNVSPATAARFRCRVSNACGTANSNPAALSVCLADGDDGSGAGVCDGGLGIEDLLFYLDRYSTGAPIADTDNGSATGIADGGVGIEDLLYFLDQFNLGC